MKQWIEGSEANFMSEAKSVSKQCVIELHNEVVSIQMRY